MNKTFSNSALKSFFFYLSHKSQAISSSTSSHTKVKLYPVSQVVTLIRIELFSNPQSFVLECAVPESSKMRVLGLNGAFWQYVSKGKPLLKESAFLLSLIIAPIHIFMDSTKKSTLHGAVVK